MCTPATQEILTQAGKSEEIASRRCRPVSQTGNIISRGKICRIKVSIVDTDMCQVLPEGVSLAHLTILENPQISALSQATDEDSQEEACALYASLCAAARVSKSLVCIDVDVSHIVLLWYDSLLTVVPGTCPWTKRGSQSVG